ncbi:hypothetical protein ABN078_03460 [Providencia huaxiensis]|uniref:Uncharacterized protein n=1 Tax=Providencia rettgeri TaxID=587 RepID=A0AAD2ZLZ0_PRORE|nr:hypothetical protein [Providencia rettgeri]ELR5219993.1 hypothetical protein [Providencia rettgeri]HEC8322948.1 hypothetical protein [Providencia rettgeri]HEC8326670.1 hypothetical protein [Providencia rettgeri]
MISYILTTETENDIRKIVSAQLSHEAAWLVLEAPREQLLDIGRLFHGVGYTLYMPLLLGT